MASRNTRSGCSKLIRISQWQLSLESSENTTLDHEHGVELAIRPGMALPGINSTDYFDHGSSKQPLPFIKYSTILRHEC